MNRWRLHLLLLFVFALGLSSATYADTFTFALIPSGGGVSGPAGSTVGWGYTITNQSTTNWLLLTGLSANPFLNGTPDASYFTFPILAPNTIATATFNSGTLTGLFGLTWDATAPVGFANTGTFILSGEFWDNDPFNGGNFVSLGVDQDAAYSATVVQGATPVPEPSTLLLLAAGLAVLTRRKSKQKRA
jgi:hypothetical protein